MATLLCLALSAARPLDAQPGDPPSGAETAPLAAPSGPSAEASPAPAAGQPAATSEPPGPSNANAGGRETAPCFGEPESTLELEARARDLEALRAGSLDPLRDSRGLFPLDPLAPETRERCLAEWSRARALAGESSSDPPPPEGSGPLRVRSYWTARHRRALGALLALDEAALRELFAAQLTRRRAALDALSTSERTRSARGAAEAERLGALAAAGSATSESARLLAEEEARLLAVLQQQERLRRALEERLTRRADRQEELLRVLRLVRDVERDARQHRASPSAALALHQQLERGLAEALAALTHSLDARVPIVPGPGADPTAEVLPLQERTRILTLRRALERGARALEADLRSELLSRRVLQQRALSEMSEAQHTLMPLLPESARRDLVGPTRTALLRAAREARQLAVTLRYDVAALVTVFDRARRDDDHRNGLLVAAGRVALLSALGAALLLGLRRRVTDALDGAERALLAQARLVGRRALRRRRRLLDVGRRLLAPATHLGVLGCVFLALPAALRAQREVTILAMLLVWPATARLVVELLDALAAEATRGAGAAATEAWRRTLALFGRGAVAVALALGVTEQGVGRGTIYAWFQGLSWLALVPLLLLLAAWWRPTVHAVLGSRGRTRGLESWVLTRRSGLLGVLAAGVGGVALLLDATQRALRAQLDQLVLTRRLLAYLFQRELDRRTEGGEAPLEELPPEGLAAFDPEAPPPTGAQVSFEDDALGAALTEPIGRLVALVGERGAGKSTAILRALEGRADALRLSAGTTPEDVAVELCRARGLPPSTDLDAALGAVCRAGTVRLLVLDDAHLLIQPRIGGLAPFDAVLEVVRRHASELGWLFVFEEALWSFFEGARGARPTFDQVLFAQRWDETELRAMVEARAASVGLELDFHRLLPRLSPRADAWERAEALSRAQRAFYRLLWDYAAGNPGVALHVLRSSLALDSSGKAIVRALRAPRAVELQDLPDSAAFVLRAVLVLGRATLAEIVALTRLPERAILDTLRHARQAGYIEPTPGGYRVTWTWYRVVTIYLERRHLIHTREAGRLA